MKTELAHYSWHYEKNRNIDSKSDEILEQIIINSITALVSEQRRTVETLRW